MPPDIIKKDVTKNYYQLGKKVGIELHKLHLASQNDLNVDSKKIAKEQKQALDLQKEFNDLTNDLNSLKVKINETKGDLNKKKKNISEFKHNKK